MIWSKFIMNFIACFIGLMIIVFLGTAFDTEMTFSWYAYTICVARQLFLDFLTIIFRPTKTDF